VKSGVRALGVDDGPQKDSTLLVGVVMRPDRIEGVLSTSVELDGNDATAAILKMVAGRFHPQIKCIFLDGVAVAGFNLINYKKLSEKLSVPVIVCTSNRPHPEEFSKALERWPEKLRLWESIRTPAHRLGGVWYQFSGCTGTQAASLIRKFQVHSLVPEPLRVAHLIAAGIELGVSRGL